MRDFFPNRINPELLKRIRDKYFPKREQPRPRPVRVIKKSTGRDEKKRDEK